MILILPFQAPGLRRGGASLERHQLCHGLSRSADDDLLAGRHPLHELGKVGLRLVNVGHLHGWTKYSPWCGAEARRKSRDDSTLLSAQQADSLRYYA